MTSHASAQDHFRQGREELRHEALDRALAHFRAAHRLDPGSRALPVLLRTRARPLRAPLGAGARAVPLCGARRVLRPDPLPQSRAPAPGVRLQGGGDPAAATRTDDRTRSTRRSPSAAAARPAPPAAAGFLRRGNRLNRWLGKLIERLRDRAPSPSRRAASPQLAVDGANAARLRLAISASACGGRAGAACASCACASSSGAS